MKKIRKQISLKNPGRILIPLILLSLTILFSVTTVSADPGVIYVNNDTGDDAWDGQSPTYISGSSGPKLSIKNAVTTVTDGGTVNIADGLYKGPDNREITIDKDMTINGESQTGTIIDGENSGRIFTINSAITVTIQNLTIQNSNADDGGAIYNNGGTLTVTDSTFDNNTADGAGGAIYNYDGTLTVTDSTFNNNTAYGAGGAIYISGGSLTVTDSTFTSNSADYGGAIFNNNGTLDVTGSTFTGNTATNYDGGAIYNSGHDSTLTVNGSTFTDNTSTNYHGGAIYNSYGTLDVTDSKFDSNTANTGGAIRNTGTLTVTDSTFTNNTANSNGGAIINWDGATMTVTGSTFTNNTANSNGGAIYNPSYDNTLTVTDTIFTNNTATNYHGGAIYNGGTLDVTGSTFTGNTADYGGAINSGGTLNVTDSTFTSNTAYRGSAIHIESGTLNVTGSTFTGNTSNWDGGAIYNNVGTLNVTGSTFTSNTAEYGGAINNSGGTLNVTGSTFTDNTASDHGGAIYNYGTLTVTGSTFTSNTASDHGGAILNYGILTVNESTFTNNTAANNGGAISNNYGNLTVTGSTFTNNTAANNGGAIYNWEGSGDVNFNRIVGNTASNGNAIYNNNGTLDATNNWWGCNGLASLQNRIENTGTGTLTYDPFIVLTLTRSTNNVLAGQTVNVTSDLLHDNQGTYHDPADGVVPFVGQAGFNTTMGTLPEKLYTDGKATSTLTGLDTTGTATVSTTVDGKTVSGLVRVHQGVTLAEIAVAAGKVKTFYNNQNRLPSKVWVGNQYLTMAQFLKILVISTLNIDQGNLDPVRVTDVADPTKPSGTYTPATISKNFYLSLAQNTKTYIHNTNRAPNNQNCALGNIPFARLVYLYSKIINHYGLYNKLPNSTYI